jgi:hypothetical protein
MIAQLLKPSREDGSTDGWPGQWFPMEQGKMKSLDFSGYVLGICAAAAMLAGCGGSQPPIGAPGAMAQTAAIVTHLDRGKSWMLPEAPSDDLLYVTNYSNVLVYSYPQGKLVGELKGFDSAAGECVDGNGDVFVTNFKPVTVYEYAHGGTKRIAAFPTKKAGTIGCAVNPANGDLAITGETSYVELFKGAEGKAIVLRDQRMFFGTFCTYDAAGDLFFAGFKDPQLDLQLSELPSGANKFVDIKVNARFEPDAGIQWDGHYLTAMSYVPWPRGKPHIFQYAVNGEQAKKIGSISLGAPAQNVLQYFISGSTLVAPNLYGSGDQYSDVLFYGFPSGGAPILTLTERITDPRGVVVSLAP